MSKLVSSRGTLAILVVLAFSFVAVATARADIMDTFTISGPSGYSDVFTLPASPTFANTSNHFSYVPGYFNLLDVTMDVNGTNTNGTANFDSNGGGVYYAGNELSLYGSSQVFSGTTAAPTFLPGDYSYPGYYYLGGSYTSSGAYTLDIAAVNASPVPEPPTLLLLGSGLIGLIGLGLFRRRETA